MSLDKVGYQVYLFPTKDLPGGWYDSELPGNPPFKRNQDREDSSVYRDLLAAYEVSKFLNQMSCESRIHRIAEEEPMSWDDVINILSFY